MRASEGTRTFILHDIDITPLIQAYDILKYGLAIAQRDLERDGVIQRFGYTYESLLGKH